MKPVDFDYRAPATVGEALADLGAGAAPLAGGQSLVAQLNARKVRPRLVVDLNKLPGLSDVDIEDDVVRIGAMTRLRTVEAHAGVAAALPVVGQAISLVAHPAIRHRSTIGGCLCHADPAGELPTLAVALGARVHLRSASGARIVAAADFFHGAHLTGRRQDELLTAVELPRHRGFRFQFAEIARPARGPLVTACLGVTTDGPVVTAARLAAGGVATHPVRLPMAEAALTGRRLDADLTPVVAAAEAELSPRLDPEYRTAVAGVLIRRAAARLAAPEEPR